VPVHIAASPAYLHQHGTPQHWRDLARHQCISDTNFRDPWNWPFITAAGDSATVPIRGRLCFSNTEACLHAAIAGLGIARLPGFIATPALQRKEIIPLLAEFAPPPMGLFALYPSARFLAQKTRLLIDFLARHFLHQPPV